MPRTHEQMNFCIREIIYQKHWVCREENRLRAQWTRADLLESGDSRGWRREYSWGEWSRTFQRILFFWSLAELPATWQWGLWTRRSQLGIHNLGECQETLVRWRRDTERRWSCSDWSWCSGRCWHRDWSDERWCGWERRLRGWLHKLCDRKHEDLRG